MNENYLESIRKQFAYYQNLANKAIEQVSDELLFWQANEESNSIAIIMKHIAGNMLSRWTDFMATDGEKEWRNREQEFEMDWTSRVEIEAYWHKAWNCLNKALNEIQAEDLEKIIYIRNQGHTVLEALNRQLSHYPYHIGQIIFLAKMLNQNWQSLSIPKGASDSFNAKKFEQPKQKGHYTDEFLEGEE